MTFFAHLWVFCGNLPPSKCCLSQQMLVSVCLALVCPGLKALKPQGHWLRGRRQICVLLHTQADQDVERGTSGCSEKQVQKAQVS